MRRVTSMSRQHVAKWLAAVQAARAKSDVAALQRLHDIAGKHSLPHIEDWGRKYFPHYIKAASSKMHVDIIATLHEMIRDRDVGQKEARIAPRKGAKTTWCSKIFPLYCICHGLEKYIMLIGDTSGQAEQNLESVKHELTSNDRLRKDYPHVCGEGTVWNVEHIVTRNQIKVQALGAGMQFRGRSFHEHRPGLIVIDDLENDKVVMSEHQRDEMFKWLSRVLIPMGYEATHFLFVGTALHEDDTLHRVLKTGEWGWKRFQALIKEPTNDQLWQQWRLLYLDLETPKDERLARALAFYEANREAMDAGAELLWPEVASLYSLMCYRTAYGESAFQSEHQGFPSSAENSEWPPSVFADTTEHRISFSVWPDTTLRVIALDPSKGKTDSSDFSAFVLLGLGTDGFLYVDADIKRRDVTRIVEDGLQLVEQFAPHMFIVETNQFQELLATEFSRQAAERGTLLPLSGFNNTIKKQVRIRRLGPYLQMGRFRFRMETEGTKELLKQLRQFPHGKHDDGPDGLDMALEGLKHLLGNDEIEADDTEQWTA